MSSSINTWLHRICHLRIFNCYLRWRQNLLLHFSMARLNLVNRSLTDYWSSYELDGLHIIYTSLKFQIAKKFMWNDVNSVTSYFRFEISLLDNMNVFDRIISVRLYSIVMEYNLNCNIFKCTIIESQQN